MLGPSTQTSVRIDMATKKTGTSLQAINAQIAALQAKAEAIRKREVDEVVAKIKQAIEHYGLTAADLGLSPSTRRSGKAQQVSKSDGKVGRKKSGGGKSAKPIRPAKYSDGQGRTWTGMGKRPDWLKAALAAGKTLDELLIKS